MFKLMKSHSTIQRLLSVTNSCTKYQEIGFDRKCLSTEETKPVNNEIKHNYDIIINGGGIVGFSLLVAMKCSPFLREKRITLLEQQRQTLPKLDNSVFGNRVSAITSATKIFFKKIGIWDELKSYAKPIKQMHVWSHYFDNGITFNSSRTEESVCYIIENDRIISALYSRLDSLDCYDVCYESVVTDIKRNGNLFDVSVKCEENQTNTISSCLLIGCDGVNSIVRQKSDLMNFEHDLQQTGIVGTIAIESDFGNDNNIAFQRFVPNDDLVIGLLPLNNMYSSFVISASKQMASRLMELDDNLFVETFNRYLFSSSAYQNNFLLNTFDKIIETILPSGCVTSEIPQFSPTKALSLIPKSRATFPLKFGTTVPFLVGSVNNSDDNKIVVIGDSAHRVHPLAGQGLNLGLGDAMTLSECLHDALSRGQHLFGGSEFHSKQLVKCLYDFERQRQLKLVAMMAAIHSMQPLFQLVTPTMINVFNKFDTVKQQIVSFANSA